MENILDPSVVNSHILENGSRRSSINPILDSELRDKTFEKAHRRSLTLLSSFTSSMLELPNNGKEENHRRPSVARSSSDRSKASAKEDLFSEAFRMAEQPPAEALTISTPVDPINIDELDRAYAVSPSDTSNLLHPPTSSSSIPIPIKNAGHSNLDHPIRPSLQSSISSNRIIKSPGIKEDDYMHRGRSISSPMIDVEHINSTAVPSKTKNLPEKPKRSHKLRNSITFAKIEDHPERKSQLRRLSSSLKCFDPEYDYNDPSLSIRRDSSTYYFSNVNETYDEEDSDLDSETSTVNWVQSVLNLPSLLSDDLMANPKNKERFEWQYMLTSVLTGDIVRSEKLRLRKIASSREGRNSDYSDNLWMEIWCWLTHRSVDSYRENLKHLRTGMVDVLLAIMNFHWDESNELTPIVAVDNMLQKLDKYERLYPSRRSILQEHSLYASESFQHKLDVLTAYSNVTHALEIQVNIIRSWVGNEEMDITKNTTNSINNVSQISNGPFVERFYRETGLIRAFEQRIMTNMNSVLSKVCNTIVTYADDLKSYGLPLIADDYMRLLSFPFRLIKEFLNLRLSCAENITSISLFTIDSLLDDLRNTMKVAVHIIQQHTVLIKPFRDDSKFVDENQSLNNILVASLKFYFNLLHRKVRNGCALLHFKETEILEGEWDFLLAVCPHIEHGFQIMSKSLSSLVGEILTNINRYLKDQLQGPDTDDSALITSFYIKVLDCVRIRFRKLMSFTRILKAHLENSCEYVIKENSLSLLIQRLEESNHVLTYTASIEHEGAYVIVPGHLVDSPNILREVLSMTFNKGDNNFESVPPYAVVLAPDSSICWNGHVTDLDIPEVSISIAPNCVRLVTLATANQLSVIEDYFISIVGDTVSLVDSAKANSSKINKQMTKIKRNSLKLALSLLDVIQTIRTRYHGMNCQNLIHYSFSYAIEFAQRLMRLSILDASSIGLIRRKMIQLAISWVGFIYEDCSPTDRNTFRWTVTALEFAMIMTYGSNILMIDKKSFEELKEKVGKCVALLLLHFDVMGTKHAGRSMDQQAGDIPARLVRNNSDRSRLSDNELASFVKEEVMHRIIELESNRRDRLYKSQLIGRVLDDTTKENRLLKELASSKSNITIRWQQGGLIGSGSFGTVYRAVNLDTGDLMAVKEVALHKPRISRPMIKRIKGEMLVLELFDHPNVVSYYGIEVHREKVNIFMELCQGSSLFEFLRYGRIEDELVIQVYVLQLLEGLAYIHSCGVSHQDVKPENILFDHNGIMKFTDFGSAKMSGSASTKIFEQLTQQEEEEFEKDSEFLQHLDQNRGYSLTGTPTYMAPELILGNPSERVGAMDIWSLGCVIVEMATGSPPWPRLDNHFSLMYHIAAHNPPIIPADDQLSPLGQNFLKRCFVSDPNQRATAAELLMDPWVYPLRAGTEFDLMNSSVVESAPSTNGAPLEL
ncbi:MAP kinase kinase kinase Win1 [Schizosaccharomyces pombe]|uniref:MAP kinase kinase kinase win1 n=1 Tax=Schizosaccharomyces pombe (strain 972 / ATCC 24843) TaxID=284812 RepID=WIN1_SCHPO|nr:MAP kinase kinase kinase Win1 [Schizosaccharomyces pombe]O74304.1 RecName: Full=MAP kinase kinase kinase win1 [Schizosaccharomyces pombe 972h-]CAA11161.1 protein kinase [Schizosaccharomyces pombe]CAB60239.2 MAP kinase kinase kinase Win1 [Schizosaccharomyces pombe]|eukprot:NP_594856.2 MAP kinase kinase kinase Win1 [Schizosaccharomyces pombe]